MPLFTPPSENTVPPFDMESAETFSREWQLMRHFRSRPAGRNVFILSDDTVTENDPWDITDGPTVVRTFHGGRADPYEVTEAERTLLEAAGYEVSD